MATTPAAPPTGHELYERFVDAAPDQWETGIRGLATIVRRVRHGFRVSRRILLRAIRRTVVRFRRTVVRLRRTVVRPLRAASIRTARQASRQRGGRYLHSILSRPLSILRTATLNGAHPATLIDARGLSSLTIALGLPQIEQAHVVLTDDPNVVMLRRHQIPYEYIPAPSGDLEFDDWLEQRVMWLRQAYALREAISFEELLAKTATKVGTTT